MTISTLQQSLQAGLPLLDKTKALLTEKNRAGLQFFKYVLCGLTALAIDMVVFFLIAWLFLPALTQNDALVQFFGITTTSIAENVRTVNFCMGNILAFVISNFVAYILNILFVFKAGKHKRYKEIFLFYLSAAMSVAIGVITGMFLINTLMLSTTFAYMVKAVISIVINFAFRKIYVFQG